MSGVVLTGESRASQTKRGKVGGVGTLLGRTKRRPRLPILSVPEPTVVALVQDYGVDAASSTDDISEGSRNQHWVTIRRGLNRKQCEDVCRLVPQTSGHPDNSAAFYGLFDGHGGRKAAEYSAAHLYEQLQSNLSDRKKDLREAFRAAFHTTDENLRKFHDAELGPSTGTTAVAVLLNERTLSVAHVGDSRAVLASHGKAICLSSDHTVEREDESKRVEDSGGFIMKKRVNGEIAVTRSIGDKVSRFLHPFRHLSHTLFSHKVVHGLQA